MGTGIVPNDLGELAPVLCQAVHDGEFDPTLLPKANNGSPVFPMWLLKHLPNMVAAHISMAFHAQGPNNTIVTACVAGDASHRRRLSPDCSRRCRHHAGRGRGQPH